jgi:hypothetical protein
MAVPEFYGNVVGGINVVLLVFTLVVEIVALLHCLSQRADAFAAVGTLSKGAWLGLMAVGILLTTLAFLGSLFFFGLMAVAIPAVYLLDVRPALRDAVDGHGPW